MHHSSASMRRIGWLASALVMGVSAFACRGESVKVFDGKAMTIIANGYSTSYEWPSILQGKIDKLTRNSGKVKVVRALKGSTPIAKWMNVATGEPNEPYLQILRPKIEEAKTNGPVIVLCQQSLQWAFGGRRETIRDVNDSERIEAGADAIERFVKLLKADGADMVFIAMHIYKHPMAPAIGYERLALAEFLKREIAGVFAGPDVWEATKELYPKAFALDGMHPNSIGSEVMAQKWFESLLRHDGRKIPPASVAEMNRAIASEPQQSRQRSSDRQQGRRRDGVETIRNVEYDPGGHERHKLDVYMAVSEKSSPRPMIVWIHGGAWRGGSKDGCPAVKFVGRGYAVASINYRLSQHAIFPAQIEDCKAAIRFLRANADKYGIDPERIGVWGSSAGGHLAALVGTSGGVKKFDVGGNLDQSSSVQAVCDYFGPTDFTKMSSFDSTMDHDAANSPESQLIGGPVQKNKDKCSAVDPITYVTKDDPPFLICHGDKDPLVPHNQSVILDEALKKAGVDVEFHTVKGGGHGGWRDPGVDKMVEQFFDRILKGDGAPQ